MDHSCCHENKQRANKKKHHKDGDGKCHHEVIGAQFNSSEMVNITRVTDKLISLYQLPVIELIHQPQLVANCKYRPKIPDREYLKFKSRQDLYILKDQLLI